MSTPKTVLYIEDDSINQMLMQRLVGRRAAPTRLVGAETGADGLRAAAQEQPDLVLLDLGLPDVSGREVLSELRAQEPTSSIPIVILSGEPASDMEAGLLELGATAYVQKPFQVQDLMQLVDDMLDVQAGAP